MPSRVRGHWHDAYIRPGMLVPTPEEHERHVGKHACAPLHLLPASPACRAVDRVEFVDRARRLAGLSAAADRAAVRAIGLWRRLRHAELRAAQSLAWRRW